MDTFSELERMAYEDDLKLRILQPGLKCESVYYCGICGEWHSESDSPYIAHAEHEAAPPVLASRRK